MIFLSSFRLWYSSQETFNCNHSPRLLSGTQQFWAEHSLLPVDEGSANRKWKNKTEHSVYNVWQQQSIYTILSVSDGSACWALFMNYQLMVVNKSSLTDMRYEQNPAFLLMWVSDWCFEFYTSFYVYHTLVMRAGAFIHFAHFLNAECQKEKYIKHTACH